MNEHVRYEYGMFNADKEKITAANGASDPDDQHWAWMWKEPIVTWPDQQTAQEWVDDENNRRAENGTLETHGPVKIRRRTITYGEWEDVEDV